MKRLIMVLCLSLFATASYAAECGRPDNVGYDPTGERKQMIYSAQDSAKNPAGVLFGCFAQFKDGLSLSALKESCGCMESIKQLCNFKRKDGKWRISASGGADAAWCVPFLPLR